MALQNRYEFMYYVACTNANPNGDPDMGNMPRIDPQTMQGFITDVATKRRIRNYIEIAYPGVPGMGIFVNHHDQRHLAPGEEHGQANAQYPRHPGKIVFVRHLQQQVFGTGIAVDAAASVLYLQ